MKLLFLHVDYIEWQGLKKALRGMEDLNAKDLEKQRVEEALGVLIAVEKGDSEKAVDKLVDEVRDVAKQVNAKNIVLYPYAHLSKNLGNPEIAVKIFSEAEKKLKKDFNVKRAPFGYYKSFELKVKGHPLSELSREIVIGGEEETKKIPKERKEGSEFSKFVLIDVGGKEYEVDENNFSKSEIWKNKSEAYKRLKQFVKNEIGKKDDKGKFPKHIEYMRKFELVDYCDVSESGNLKWYPSGVLMRKLLLQYANKLAVDWGASEMSNPLIIRGDNNIVGELMGEFHERDYKVDGGRGIGYLRYASDPLGFPFMQNVKFTYKQSPLKVYEEASCFRNEQEGEVSGLKRVRNFLMTDMHAACSTEKEAKKEFELLCYKFGDLMNDIIAKGRWILGWEGTIDFYNKNKKWMIAISKKLGVPSFFKLSSEMNHYYAIKNEYQTILEDNSNLQISTVQWDVKDGPRFNIGYINDKGKKVACPVILHASSFGSIERTLCSILENIAIDEKEGKIPKFPYWLSPTQLRLLPISDKFNKEAIKLAQEFFKNNIRADVDDRNETSKKKIVDSEKYWVPFTIFVGDKELKNNVFALRERGRKGLVNMSKEDLIFKFKEFQGDMPWRNLPLPLLLSQRPGFI